MAKRKRRKFTEDFKADVVKLVQEGRQSGRSVPQICLDLDLGQTAVRTWVERAEAAEATGQPAEVVSEQEELERLRKEVRVLRMEREILKKAAAFFAKENT